MARVKHITKPALALELGKSIFIHTKFSMDKQLHTNANQYMTSSFIFTHALSLLASITEVCFIQTVVYNKQVNDCNVISLVALYISKVLQLLKHVSGNIPVKH